MGKGAHGATGGIDVGDRKVAAGLAEREADGLAAAGDGARAAARHDHRGSGAVGVVGQADLVVGLVHIRASGGVGESVFVGVACSVSELACQNAHCGCAKAVGGGREGHLVAAAGAGKAAQSAAGDGDVGFAEVGAGFAEREVDHLGAVDLAGGAAADHHGGGGGVRCLGVVGDADLVVGLLRGA